MNPHASRTKNIIELFKHLAANTELIKALTKREIKSRYQGSILGTTWSLLTPILMLLVFTFVFSEIFSSRWPGTANAGGINFATALFSGLILFSFLSEVVSRSPGLILENQNYVSKVIFPIEALSIISTAAATFQLLITYAILVILLQFSDWEINLTALWIIPIVIPLIILAAGLSWAISAIGVYIRDINQLIGPALTVTMFLSPIFYEMSSVKKNIIWIYQINPLAYAIEASRAALLHGRSPDAVNFAYYAITCLALTYIGHLIFQKTKRGFADVI